MIALSYIYSDNRLGYFSKAKAIKLIKKANAADTKGSLGGLLWLDQNMLTSMLQKKIAAKGFLPTYRDRRLDTRTISGINKFCRANSIGKQCAAGLLSKKA